MTESSLYLFLFLYNSILPLYCLKKLSKADIKEIQYSKQQIQSKTLKQ